MNARLTLIPALLAGASVLAASGCTSAELTAPETGAPGPAFRNHADHVSPEGLEGQLVSLANLLQVEDARLGAIADGFVAPVGGINPCVLEALAAIQTAALNIVQAAEEMERVAGAPVPPPEDETPPDPVHPPDPVLPPAALEGQLESIARVLASLETRLAELADGFVPPVGGINPCTLEALATIKAEALSILAAAEELEAELVR